MLLLICFFLNFFSTLESKNIEKRNEFINVFQSDVYGTYLNQRDAFLAPYSQAIEEMAQRQALRELYELITYKGKKGSVYQTQFMTTLRDGLAKKGNGNHAVQNFLDDLTVWMFSTPQLDAPFRKFISTSLQLNIDAFATGDPKHLFMKMHKKISHHPHFASAHVTKETPLLEDNLKEGDLPTYLFNIGTIEVIRTPNVAHDLLADENGETVAATLDGEFVNYIETMAKRNKKHFYVNLMSRKNGEGKKGVLIEGMELDPQTRDGIIVITLDKKKDSPFYFQKAPYDTLIEMEGFKAAFYQKLLDPNGLYYWSKRLDPQQWRSTLNDLIDEVHAEFFDNAPILDSESRSDFIELTYVKIIDHLCQHFKPTRLNVSCKASVDRGPSLYTLLFLHEKSKQSALQPKDYSQALTLLFAPPLVFHNRGAHIYRISILQSSANRLQTQLKQEPFSFQK